MIDSLEIINFQSHSDSHLQFHKGINAIIGDSDNGKTAVLRALKLARYNQPSGKSFISKWAFNDKGKQDDDMSVTIKKGKNTLIRGKGKELDGYNVNGKVLTALGKGGLPDEVPLFFNMTDVNIQEQMDTPFLIGQKPAAIAKFLNTIVDMTEIDEYLSCVDSKKRSNNKDRTRVKQEIEELEKKLAKYDGLEAIQSSINKYEKIQNRIKTKKESVQVLNTLVDTISNLKEKVKVYSVIPKIEALLPKWESYSKKIEKKKKTVRVLKKEIVTIEDNKEILKSTENIGKIDPLLKKVEKLTETITGKKKMAKDLGTLVRVIEDNTKTVKRCTCTIEELEEELPEICPLCGKPMEGKDV